MVGNMESSTVAADIRKAAKRHGLWAVSTKNTGKMAVVGCGGSKVPVKNVHTQGLGG